MIRERTEQLEKLCAKIVRQGDADRIAVPNGQRPGSDDQLSDDRILELLRGARNAAEFEDLYDQGDASRYGDDHSRADQALLSKMAFYTQDSDQLDRLFRGSALYRAEKWGGRSDYRRRTIDKALQGLTETYAPTVRAAPSGNGHREPASPSPSHYKGKGRRAAFETATSREFRRALRAR